MFNNHSQFTLTEQPFIFPNPPRNLNCRKTYNKLREVLGLPEKSYRAPKTARETLEAHEREEKEKKNKKD